MRLQGRRRLLSWHCCCGGLQRSRPRRPTARLQASASCRPRGLLVRALTRGLLGLRRLVLPVVGLLLPWRRLRVRAGAFRQHGLRQRGRAWCGCHSLELVLVLVLVLALLGLLLGVGGRRGGLLGGHGGPLPIAPYAVLLGSQGRAGRRCGHGCVGGGGSHSPMHRPLCGWQRGAVLSGAACISRGRAGTARPKDDRLLGRDWRMRRWQGQGQQQRCRRVAAIVRGKLSSSGSAVLLRGRHHHLHGRRRWLLCRERALWGRLRQLNPQAAAVHAAAMPAAGLWTSQRRQGSRSCCCCVRRRAAGGDRASGGIGLGMRRRGVKKAGQGSREACGRRASCARGIRITELAGVWLPNQATQWQHGQSVRGKANNMEHALC